MSEAEGKADKGLMTTIIVILLLSVMGAGAGFAVGIFVQPAMETDHGATPGNAGPTEDSPNKASTGESHKQQSETEAAATGPMGSDGSQANLKVVAIPPVVTTLATPEGKWIRFEGAVLVDPAGETSPELLAEQSGEHVLSYLRTLKLEQLQGPSGLLALKDDLGDTVSVLSKGQVKDLLIHGLLVE